MDATADRGAFAEAVVFLSYFDDLPDPRQRGKVVYPLDEVLLLALLGVLAGAETLLISPGSGRRSSRFCAASGHFAMGRRRMITWATSSPRLTPRRSSVASSPGSLRWSERRPR